MGMQLSYQILSIVIGSVMCDYQVTFCGDVDSDTLQNVGDCNALNYVVI